MSDKEWPDLNPGAWGRVVHSLLGHAGDPSATHDERVAAARAWELLYGAGSMDAKRIEGLRPYLKVQEKLEELKRKFENEEVRLNVLDKIKALKWVLGEVEDL